MVLNIMPGANPDFYVLVLTALDHPPIAETQFSIFAQ